MTQQQEKLHWYKRIPFRKTLTLLFFIVLIYLLLIIFARKVETIFTFPGMRVSYESATKQNTTSLELEEINIKNNKGEIINGLFIDKKAEKTIYYFHGNGGPLPVFYSKLKYYADLGYNVMAYDYPNYGKSSGFPYHKDIVENSETFWKYISEERGLSEEDLIVGAHSIGTAISIEFVKNHQNIDKLFLISALSSRYDMSKHIFGFALQPYLFLENSFVSSNSVKNFKVPVLFIHGNTDKIVPFWQGEKVFRAYEGEKNFIEIDNFGHNNIIHKYGEALKPIFQDFLNGRNLDFQAHYLLLDTEAKQKLIEKARKRAFLESLDLETDSSLHKFVTLTKSFDDKGYIPKNLEKISSEYIYDARGGQVMRKEANVALQKMGSAFKKEFGKKMVNVSAYRSYLTQKRIKDGGCPDKFCAKAGHSEHQSGLAIDFFAATTQAQFLANPDYRKYFEWMKKNAHTYGFHNTYQRGIEIDGYVVEPWHWRYLGVEFATYLKEKNLTIAEYYQQVSGK